MKQRLWSIFNNESSLGRAMNVCGIVIAANIMFVLVSTPVVTAGPAFAAMYHVMLRFLRSDGEINPFKEFWTGLKNNFRQAIIVWLLFLVVVIIGIMDIRFAMYAKGVMTIFKYLIYLIFGIALILCRHHPAPCAEQRIFRIKESGQSSRDCRSEHRSDHPDLL